MIKSGNGSKKKKLINITIKIGYQIMKIDDKKWKSMKTKNKVKNYTKIKRQIMMIKY